MERPPVHYALTDDGVNIAYQVFGEGPFDVLFVGSWFGQIDMRWEWPGYRRWLERLGSFARVMVFDKRGVGASDPAPAASLTMEAWMDDGRVVMDAVGSTSAAVVAWTDASPMALLYAAGHPESVRALVVVNWVGRVLFQGGPLPERISWGDRGLAWLATVAPSSASDPGFVDWFLRFQRAACGPGPAQAMYAINRASNVEAVIPSVAVPTAFIYRAELVDLVAARARAALVPGSTFVVVPGRDLHVWAGDVDPLIDEVQTFLTGVRPQREPDRALLTVLFSDIVGSTSRAVELGDKPWSGLLDAHNRNVRATIAAHHGREVLTKGDEFVVTFDGPARAVRCAQAIHAAAAQQGLEMRTGIHIGEVELRGDDIAGIAVHIGARVRELAEPGEILVTRTVKDLVAGSGLEFTDRGAHTLKGVPEEWQLFAAT